MTKFNMAHLQQQVGLIEGLFIMRSKGARAYPILEAQLQDIPENDVLVLNFPPDQLIDVSFADETISRLGQAITDHQFGQRRLLLKGLTPDSIDNLNNAIRGQKLKLAFIHLNNTSDWEIIGHLEPSLREALNLLTTQNRLTAPELAQELELALNTANNRLKRLHDQGLIQREYEVTDKGLLYYYYFPIPTADRESK